MAWLNVHDVVQVANATCPRVPPARRQSISAINELLRPSQRGKQPPRPSRRGILSREIPFLKEEVQAAVDSTWGAKSTGQLEKSQADILKQAIDASIGNAVQRSSASSTDNYEGGIAGSRMPTLKRTLENIIDKIKFSHNASFVDCEIQSLKTRLAEAIDSFANSTVPDSGPAKEPLSTSSRVDDNTAVLAVQDIPNDRNLTSIIESQETHNEMRFRESLSITTQACISLNVGTSDLLGATSDRLQALSTSLKDIRESSRNVVELSNWIKDDLEEPAHQQIICNIMAIVIVLEKLINNLKHLTFKPLK